MTDEEFMKAISAGPGPLVHLSIQKTKRGAAPAALTNEERRREFDAVKVSSLNNPTRWRHLEKK